jgi:hypothetical protein
MPPTQVKIDTQGPLKLTTINLAEFTRQQASLWANIEISEELRMQLSNTTKVVAHNLGINLPNAIMASVVGRLDGMIPMERYTSDNNSECWTGNDMSAT